MSKHDEHQKTMDRLNAGIKALPQLIELVERMTTNDVLEACGAAGVKSRRHAWHNEAAEALRLAKQFKPLAGRTINVDFLEREGDDPEFAYASLVYIDHPIDIAEGVPTIDAT